MEKLTRQLNESGTSTKILELKLMIVAYLAL